MKKTIMVAAAIFALAGCSTPTDTPLSTEPVAATPEASSTSPAAKTIANGTWTIGEDFPAGTYKVINVAKEDCYWAITQDEEIVKNGYGGGLPKVTLKKGQTFESMSCPAWRKIK